MLINGKEFNLFNNMLDSGALGSSRFDGVFSLALTKVDFYNL
jgi:hypothetical protein